VNKLRQNMRRLFRVAFSIMFVFMGGYLFAQVNNAGSGLGKSIQEKRVVENLKPKEYELAGITVSGSKYLDQDLLVTVTNLTLGQKIHLPNDETIAKAIKNLWKQELFSNVNITISKIVEDKVFLNIGVEERPRLSRYNFKNIKPSEAKDLKSKLTLITNKVVTDATKKEAVVRIKNFYSDKGYDRATVSIHERLDTAGVNKVILTFIIDKGKKTHINQINIYGCENADESRLKRTLKSTKEMSRFTLHPDGDSARNSERSFLKYVKNLGFLSLTQTLDALDPYFKFRMFSSSKFNASKFEEDKQSLINYYNSLGYRDATVTKDTVYPSGNGNINIDVTVREGKKYYFGDITWKGNTKYTNEYLARTLGIHKGDVYNYSLLESRIGKQLSPDGNGDDISGLYMDYGYLFFNIDPTETSVNNDTINFEMRITEGTQATIRDVHIFGNERTSEFVIRRELFTVPGNKFSRTDLIRSQRQIASLGFFDQEKIGISPKPHPEDGTVDIDYTVVEKSSDQMQLSAGFGGGMGFYGTLGITFNNFSVKNILKPAFWDPLPVGDGEKFSVNYSSNGSYANTLNTSFTEPWLGGKKPNSMTANIVYSRYSSAPVGTDPNSAFLRVVGGGLSFGKRLRWPDNYFIFNYGFFYNNFRLNNYALISNFANGYSNDFHVKLILSRNSLDQPLYPRSGSNISFTFQFTPPYSVFSGRDFSAETPNQKYEWIEYHKYKFNADFYQRIIGNLVLRMTAKYGYMGYYNRSIGYSPFERFQVGGDGLSAYSNIIGKEIISQRGYEIYQTAGTIFNKYVTEVRYPFSLSPTATIYGLAFFDAANAWTDFTTYNPFRLNRDVGVGIRIFLPMFGLLGLDYGIGIDRYDPNNNITGLKDMGKFNFMLGFEPE
jgi:outer membrane protein insertion porin family